ncbi:LysR family transcriptional regulator [Roseibium aggregatum]|uniref:LysR family transcriptional regulator n=1 Tax=Roseibium aggregatum TaxID=187304 RepID=A0A926S949_9HYPH|nr:LysR family transcriptional regulator [Roseibium aggregatum]MBD1546009.1 LysR family transcriptional regulator [Roseibium aggregatum]
MHIETRLTLKQLRAFVAVYRLGKLADAADELGVSLSAVSALIRQIEETLNTRLFDRSTRTLAPTRAADEAFGIAERILQDVVTLGSNFRDLSEGSRGRVHLAATPATAATLLPGTARRFARRYGNIQLVLDDCAPSQFLPHIVSERVEMGIGTPAPAGAGCDNRLILSDALQVVCAEDHPFAVRDEVPWRDLADVQLITFRGGPYGVRDLVDRTLMHVGAQPDVAHEVGFLETAAWMAASGLGVAILPAALAATHRHQGLATRPLVAPEVSRSIALVTKKGRSLSPACKLFVDMVVEDIGNVG